MLTSVLLCFKNITSVLLCKKHCHGVGVQVAKAAFCAGSWTLLVKTQYLCEEQADLMCSLLHCCTILWLNTTLYTPTQIVHDSRAASLYVLFYFIPHCLWVKNWFHLQQRRKLASIFSLLKENWINHYILFQCLMRQRDGLRQNKYYTLRYIWILK